MTEIKNFFKRENIEFYAILPTSAVRVINPARSKDISGFDSVICFVVPYKTDLSPRRNVARFAALRDYHMYAAGLFERFKAICPECRCFCDNSPIDEKHFASVAGLGIVGENSLIINEKYGSFIFLGEIFLNLPSSFYSPFHSPRRCISCGKCKAACPVGLDFTKCISALTQKKKINAEEEKTIKNSPCKWGCDLCQDVCPYNVVAPQTPIDFFKTEIVDVLTAEKVDEMVENDTFKHRAYAWRGVDTIKRNLNL